MSEPKERIIQEHLRDSTEALRGILAAPKFSKGLRQCTECRKLYASRQTLAAHLLLKHPSDGGEAVCNICAKVYSSSISLQKHFRYMHTYDHRCGVCYRNFDSAISLARHQIKCAPDTTVCPVCSKMFGSEIALKSHIKYKHPADKRHECVDCKRVFTSELRLLNHVRTVHQVEAKRFKSAIKCDKCRKRFKNVATRARHCSEMHSKSSPKCKICLKTLKTNASLLNHLASVHRDVVDAKRSVKNTQARARTTAKEANEETVTIAVTVA